jgi:hypothetical protein
MQQHSILNRILYRKAPAGHSTENRAPPTSVPSGRSTIQSWRSNGALYLPIPTRPLYTSRAAHA